MNIEERLDLLTQALEANTAAHLKLAEVALAASSGKTAPAEDKKAPAKDKPAPAETEETPEDDAAEKKKAAAAKKKAAAAAAAKKKAEAEKAAAAEAPEIETSVSVDDMRAAVKAHMETDDEEVRATRMSNLKGALAHLGLGKLSEVTEDDAVAKLAGYVAYWKAGVEFSFEDVDSIIDAADTGSDEDDPLG